MKLEDRLIKIPEELLRLQTTEYIEFIRDFNDRYNIMSKFFYVVIPFGGTGATNKKGSTSGGMFDFLKTKKSKGQINTEAFEEKRSQLEQRIAVVTQGLSSMGVQSKQLTTEQLVELYQSHFNPGELHAAVKS